MRRGGPTKTPPSEKKARGTYQPCRDDGAVEIVPEGCVITMRDPPTQPDWLTEEGKEVWLDDVGRVCATRLVTEADSTMFATYCNMQGAAIMAWRSGGVPPPTHLAETRKMAEQFGLMGRKSRVVQGVKDNGATENPFARNGRKPITVQA